MTNSASRLVAGRYRLGVMLGRGTMGTVWAAHDEMLGRPVAIKEVLLPPGIPQTEADALRERCLREARAIAALSHPNVVTLYDVAWEGAAPFVVMELVASASLAELLRQGPLPPRQVLAIGAAVAAALQAAHAAGITHRDIKPGNVLMAHDGRIKLTDFGIARNGADQTLTATGLMLGSPAYIAPEIASGAPVTPASDLWGLGATLFAAVEGKPPYDAGTAMATVASVVQDEVPRPSCSGALAEVINGLMVKDPARRMPLSRVRQLLGAAGESADAPPASLEPANRRAGEHLGARVGAVSAPRDGPDTLPEPLPGPLRGGGRLAAEPGPLPFPVLAAAPAHRRENTRIKVTAAGRRIVLWTLAALLFLSAASTGFGIARLASGATALPSLRALPQLRAGAVAGTSHDDVALTPREVTEQGGAQPARFTVTVPQDWPAFQEKRTLGTSSASVTRFVSPDGSEVISVERITGVLPDGDVDHYLSTYLRTLAQGVPELVETQRQRLAGDALEATFRSRQGGELRRTTYLRLIPASPQLWAVSVTVPTDREAAGRMRLFEPLVARFTPGL